jgi:hypothetical protein
MLFKNVTYHKVSDNTMLLTTYTHKTRQSPHRGSDLLLRIVGTEHIIVDLGAYGVAL